MPETFCFFNAVINKLKAAPDNKVKLKITEVLYRNLDLQFLRVYILQETEFFPSCKQLKNMSPSELDALCLAPLVSTDMDHSVS